MNLFKSFQTVLRKFYVTNSKQTPEISKIRDIETIQTRDTRKADTKVFTEQEKPKDYILSCPYCTGKDTVKKGLRKKKLETIQLYYCNDCKRVFTPIKTL